MQAEATMRNKKGVIGLPLEEVIKIVLAVIGIAALVYLSYSLYGILQNKTRIEQARANLDEIANKMSALKEGESVNYMLITPKGYSLIGWPLADSKTGVMPKQCDEQYWKNCLCMCNYAGTYGAEEDKMYLSWLLKLGGISVWNAIANWRELSHMDEKVLDACNSGGLCKQVNNSTVIRGIKQAVTLDELKNEVSSPGSSIGRVFELNVLIRVDELMKTKKQLTISLNNGVYTISTQ